MDVVEGHDAGVDIGRVEIALGGGVVVGAVGIRCHGAALCDDDDLVSRGASFANGSAKRVANGSFARLVAIRERRVEDVRPFLEQVAYDASIEQVVDTAGIAAERAEGDGGKPEIVGPREMIRRGESSRVFKAFSQAIGKAAGANTGSASREQFGGVGNWRSHGSGNLPCATVSA